MREIKFRAKALTGELIYFGLHESRLSGDPDIVFYVGDMPCEVGSEQEYIGLKDKNGKEAYWDDIVNDGINPVFVITSDYHLLARLSEIEFEVIGNICENPELVEVGGKQ